MCIICLIVGISTPMPIATVAKTTLLFGLFDDRSEVHDTAQIFGFQELVEPLLDSIELNLIFF